MGFGTSLKAQKAYREQQKGNNEEAMRIYEICFNEGLSDVKFVLAYAVLLLRSGQYEKAKDLLVKHQNAPGMTPEQKVNLFVDYAVCIYKLGQLDKAIARLEDIQRDKGKRSLIYETLGYLYVEKYQLSAKDGFIAAYNAKLEEKRLAAERAAAKAAAGETVEAEPVEAVKFPEYHPEQQEEAESAPAADVPEMTAEEAWAAGVEKALAYNLEGADYDDEDAVCMDNVAQVYYRVLGDREAARPWFDKAISLKPGQIDTLYFLSRYDLEEGKKGEALEKLEKAAEGRFSPLNYCTKDMVTAEIRALKGE